MNSLRTDDIIGAVPRIRHMPKNYYRFGYPYKHQVNDCGGQDSKLRGGDYNNGYNNNGKLDKFYHDDMNGGYSYLNHYDTNPFIVNQNIKPNTQRSRHSNINDFNLNNKSELNNYYNNQFTMQNNSSNRRQRSIISGDRRQTSRPRINSSSVNNDMIINSSSNNIIHSKQLPFINYLQLKQSSINNYQPQQQVNMKQQHHHRQISQQSKAKDRNNQQRDTSSSTIIREKNIFRGIGFNIITNSKYQYNLQTTTTNNPSTLGKHLS